MNHSAANDTANSDAAKDRFVNVLLSAQLSGRRLLAMITKDAALLVAGGIMWSQHAA
jgi:hypothetical protein